MYSALLFFAHSFISQELARSGAYEARTRQIQGSICVWHKSDTDTRMACVRHGLTVFDTSQRRWLAGHGQHGAGLIADTIFVENSCCLLGGVGPQPVNEAGKPDPLLLY